jgi:hypothetical protein
MPNPTLVTRKTCVAVRRFTQFLSQINFNGCSNYRRASIAAKTVYLLLSQRGRERSGSDCGTSRNFHSVLKLLSAHVTGVVSQDSLTRGPSDATKFGSIITL